MVAAVKKRPASLLIKTLAGQFRNQRVLFQLSAGLSCDTSRVSYHVFMLTINSALLLSLKNICWDEPFLRLPGAKTRKCFLSFQENNFAENGEMFSNPSLEMRFRLVKAEIHWAVKYRLSDGKIIRRGIIRWKNYIPRIIWQRRGIIWKLQRIKLLAWALSSTCCLKTAAVALKRKGIDKNVVER